MGVYAVLHLPQAAMGSGAPHLRLGRHQQQGREEGQAPREEAGKRRGLLRGAAFSSHPRTAASPCRQPTQRGAAS